ncbi:GapR family DNA-binding domain-containing protein [Bradyrhizobium sp. UFLA05-109]
MAKAANTSNDFEPEVVQELLGKIDGYHADLASERGTFMKTCRSIRESISNVYTEAKARGIPEKELRSLVRIRLNEQKNRKIYEELEADQQLTLSMLATAEGVKDLPLWRAAAMMGDASATAH